MLFGLVTFLSLYGRDELFKCFYDMLSTLLYLSSLEHIKPTKLNGICSNKIWCDETLKPTVNHQPRTIHFNGHVRTDHKQAYDIPFWIFVPTRDTLYTRSLARRTHRFPLSHGQDDWENRENVSVVRVADIISEKYYIGVLAEGDMNTSDTMCERVSEQTTTLDCVRYGFFFYFFFIFGCFCSSISSYWPTECGLKRDERARAWEPIAIAMPCNAPANTHCDQRDGKICFSSRIRRIYIV